MRNQSFIGHAFLLLLIVGGATGCHKPPSQSEVEHGLANNVISMLVGYEIENPGVRVTNLAQVFVEPMPKYPFRWHQRLEPFGKNAGFKHSIFEKYVFPPPRITNNAIGEVVFLNGQPFLAHGELGRMIASRMGTGVGSYRLSWYGEKQVQDIFRAAGKEIPKPTPMPPPPPFPPEQRLPLDVRINNAFFGFTDALGLSHETASTLWYLLWTLPLVALFLWWATWLWRFFFGGRFRK